MSDYNYDVLIPVVQEALLAQGVRIPHWGDHGRQARSAFDAEVLKILVDRRDLGVHDADLSAVAEEVASRMLGLGVLDPYLRREQVEEIIVRDGHVQVERRGRIEDVGKLASDGYFRRLAERVAEYGGRTLRAADPFVLVDLPDGSRFTAMIPPLSVLGTAINVRVFARLAMTVQELVECDSLTAQMADYLVQAVQGLRKSLLISGRPGAGKTTLLNALSFHFPEHAQLCVVETFQELQLAHPHLARAVVKQTAQGKEEQVSMAQVVNVLYTRMRPDVVIVGETVSGEAVEFLRAVNLGVVAHTTIHGNSPTDALYRLERLALQPNVPLLATREAVARGVNVVVHLDRDDETGRRFVQQVTEVQGLDERDHYVLRTVMTREA